jgi:O-methyltransferase involved in polyketide biosynthesis
METPGRDFTSISPSAQSLLLMKGMTNIPYAKEAAALMVAPAKYEPDTSNRDTFFWARLSHFEMRYWSIDQLLGDLPIKNILELSSGFSFRGLQMIRKNNIHYIDTDLPDLIKIKQQFIHSLQTEADQDAGQLETLPLNVLDEEKFREIISHFPEGEIIIVNEGLLMYLDMSEKEKLCRIIHDILEERGGYWITADIYIKRDIDNRLHGFNKTEKEFFEKHHIEENKFDSFESAAKFFTDMGFVIDKQSETDHTQITALGYLMKQATPEELEKMRNAGRIRTTWQLKIKK